MIEWFLLLPKAGKIALGLGIILALLLGYILWLRWDNEVKTRQKVAAETNANLNQQKAEALKVLIQANTVTAQEVQHAKEVANQLAENSNISGNNFNTIVNRQSNSYSNANSDNEFCSVFPDDDTCAAWRAKYHIVLKEH